jgi:hypothetical protein
MSTSSDTGTGGVVASTLGFISARAALVETYDTFPRRYRMKILGGEKKK